MPHEEGGRPPTGRAAARHRSTKKGKKGGMTRSGALRAACLSPKKLDRGLKRRQIVRADRGRALDGHEGTLGKQKALLERFVLLDRNT